MGINSTEVSYGFGQMGSMLVDGTDAFYPPKGMVVVAITVLADATFNATNGLVSDLETLTGGSNSPWISTNADAHGTGLLATQNAHNNGGTGHGTGIITIGTASTLIKKGMIVEEATMCPRSLTDPYVVHSHDGTTTAAGLTVAKKSNPNTPTAVAANLASGSAAEILFFSENGQGAGGVEMDASNTIPRGVTIYGRWTQGVLTAGEIICYFGQ